MAGFAYAIDSPLTDLELASIPCSNPNRQEHADPRGLKAGESVPVTVTGASGSVGSATIQLACARDAHAIEVTRPSKAWA